MAIIKLTDSKYTGKASDIKPANAKIGSSFYEYDTEAIYDKTLNYELNNGWKLRNSSEETNEIATTLKGNITTKTKNGIDYIVIMAGENTINFEENDIIMGSPEVGRAIVARVKNQNYNTLADLSIMMDGREFNP